MTNLQMPKVEKSIISNKDKIVSDISKIIKEDNILSHVDEIKPYETDALAAYKQAPLIVVLPETVEEVSAILKYCNENKIKVVPRGAGTGLSGGALPLADCVLLAMGKFNKIIELDFNNKCVVAQPCVTNLAITHAVQDKGFYYAPDPSSQIACSIGGNVAENSGGVHSLKYGATTNNLLGIEVVLMDGTIARFGGKTMDAEGYDFLGLMTGSEGLLAVITEVTVKILKSPEIVKTALVGFSTIDDAGNCVAQIIAQGCIPAGMEIMDKALTKATNDYSKAGYPTDAEAMMIIEFDGTEHEVEEYINKVKKIAEKNNSSSLKISKSKEERLKFWAGRKAAFPACGVLAPDYMCMDGSIPRGKLAEVLKEITRLSKKYDIVVFTAKAKSDRPLVDGKTGAELIWDWLGKYNLIPYIKLVTAEKPRAVAYIDDKAIHFTNWEQTLKEILHDSR